MPAAARGRGDAALLGTAEKGGPGTEMDRCLLGCREAERDEEGRALKSVPAECCRGLRQHGAAEMMPVCLESVSCVCVPRRSGSLGVSVSGKKGERPDWQRHLRGAAA